jgi:predicted amidohydrolase
MPLFRFALASVPFAATPDESVALAQRAIADAAAAGAELVCFPECYVPGYRWPGTPPLLPLPSADFLERAWSSIADAAASANVAVILGTERLVEGRLLITALVINKDGSRAGFQDKIQIDPSEEVTYSCGAGRRIFECGALRFGIVICHEGWRYPETVRWAAKRGAHVVFHPHAGVAEPGSYRPTVFADPANSFHEKAALCRAAENSCFFATVNYASDGSPTTSAVVSPDGTVMCYQPYGKAGLLVADVDLGEATGLLASRCRTYE